MTVPALRNPEKILVVDDTAENVRLLTQILRERGYAVRAATSGPRALASVEADPPDLILLDIRMPDIDGYQVCRLIKANLKSIDIPVLFISALDEIQDKVRAFDAGGVDYITKPFQLEEVLARVKTHLALRQLQRHLQEANIRMKNELTLAAQVQASFMPRKFPPMPGWDLSVSLTPAQMTSGDFFDVFKLPGGEVGILIADVVDKGVGAALFMAMCSGLLRTYLLEHANQPEVVCQAVNQRIIEYTTANQFVTVFLGILDIESGKLIYSNGGHNPPLLVNPEDNSINQLTLTGPALGIIEDVSWQAKQVDLRSKDTLVLYTDGVTEANDVDLEMFGMERFCDTVRSNATATAEGMKRVILEDVQEFMGDAPQADDIALVILKRN